jgi:hypothetical protein
MMRGRLLLLALACAGAAFGQAVPVNPGPAVGARAPEFQLSDQHGLSRDVRSLAGPKGLMLVLIRSADW